MKNINWWNNFKHTCESIYLCIKYPFLYPRNRFSGRHWTSWVFEQYLYGKRAEYKNEKQEDGTYRAVLVVPATNGLYGKAYKTTTEEIDGTEYIFDVVDSKFWWLWFHVVRFVYDFLSIFYCIPTYTEWDAIPSGWRKAFGQQYLDELRAQLKKDKLLYKFRILQIKEKFNSLRLYCNYATDAVYDIINKYENLAQEYCIECGKPATVITDGYYLSYCDECYEKHTPHYFIYAKKVNGKWINIEKEREREEKKKRKHPDILLPNRDGDKNYLVFLYKGRTKENLLWYKLKLDNEDWVRVTCENGRKTIYAIDPSGGPYMNNDGFVINNMKLEKIVFKKGEGFKLGFVKI